MSSGNPYQKLCIAKTNILPEIHEQTLEGLPGGVLENSSDRGRRGSRPVLLGHEVPLG